MKIALSANQFFDDEGRPLVNGRISVHIHASDVLADIYTLSSHGYVQADNPFITADDGRIPSLFFEATVVDVWVEKQLGDGTYELLDTYQDGFQLPSTKNDTVVYGVSALQDVDPNVGLVCVSGYESADDAPTRYFVWDSNCTLDGDGGVVWESNGGSSGRWVMLWEGATMPSSVYGIQPGVNEANIAAFLDYPDKIGNIAYPQIRRFLKGTYTSNTTYVCTRPVMFDVGAQFVSAVFDIPYAVILQNTSYVADFLFSDKAEAHSCWFRTVNFWWHCGASRMTIDATNYFTSTDLGTEALLDNVTLEGATRILTTYVNGAYLKLNGCTIQGKTIFSPTVDYIRFANCAFNQEWFTSAGYSQWSFGTVPTAHVQVSSSDNVSCPWQNFSSTSVYWKALASRSETEFDGHGGTVQPVQNSTFTTIRNCTFATYLNDTKCTLFENVKVTSTIAFMGTQRAVTMRNCSFALSGTSMNLSVATLEDCNVRAGGDWYPDVTALVVKGGKWEAGIVLSATAQANRTHNKSVSFTDVDIDVGGYSFHLNDIEMTRCKSNAHVYLVPWNDSGTFRSHGYFRDNWFHLGSLIDINVKNPAAEWDVQDVVLDLLFMDNVFAQTDSRGIAIPFLTGLYDVTKHYVSLYSQGIYQGNTGNCPAEKSTRYYRQDSMDQEYTLQGSIKMYYQGHTYDQRVWNLTPQNDWTHGDLGIEFEPSSDSWNMINGRDARAWYDRLLHVAYRNPVDAYNDQFLCVHACESDDGYDTDNIVMLF